MRLTPHDAGSLEDFLRDPRLSRRVKIENLVLVEQGLRPCSQTTLPFDLVNASEMGAAIDRRIYPLMDRLRAVQDPGRRLKAIEHVKGEMRKAFREIVESSEQCSALKEWAEALGLRRLTFQVRPTVQDLYLVKEKGVEAKMRGLMKRRQRLKDSMQRFRSPSMDRIRFAYPEEFQGSWLREIGELLGYPICCADLYASEREDGSSVEDRAAKQIEEAERQGSVDPFAYFVGYFFPCNPRCEAAISKGMECHDRLQALDPRLGELYKNLVAENLEIVRRQPSIIAEYRSKVSGTSRP